MPRSGTSQVEGLGRVEHDDVAALQVRGRRRAGDEDAVADEQGVLHRPARDAEGRDEEGADEQRRAAAARGPEQPAHAAVMPLGGWVRRRRGGRTAARGSSRHSCREGPNGIHRARVVIGRCVATSVGLLGLGLGRDGVALLADLGGLAAQATQVVELRATHVTAA